MRTHLGLSEANYLFQKRKTHQLTNSLQLALENILLGNSGHPWDLLLSPFERTWMW